MKTDSDYLAMMESVITTLTQKADKMKTLSMILPHALTIAGVELGALLVVDDKPNKLTVVIRQGLPDEIIQHLTGGELAQELLSGKQLHLTSKALQLNPRQAILGRHKLKYLFGIPLRFYKDVLGAIIIGTRQAHSHVLAPESQQRLTTLAQLIALFLDDVRLRTNNRSRQGHEAAYPILPAKPDSTNELEELLAAVMSAEEEVARQNNDLGLLNTLSREVNGILQLDTIMEAAIKRTKAAFNAEAGWFYLFEDEALILQRHEGLSEKYVREMRQLKLGDGAEGMAFSRRKPILRDALLFHSGQMRAVVEAEGLRAVAAIPLVAAPSNHVFGVLAIGYHAPHQWSTRDERMLTSIGRQVAQAVANSQMFAEAQNQAATWESKYSAIQQSNTQLAQRAAILEKQVQELRRVEQQIWTALAASQEARRNRLHGQDSALLRDDQLMNTLRKVLDTLSKNEESLELAK